MNNQPVVPVPTPSGFDIIAAIMGVEVDIIKLGVGYARVAYRKLVVALFAMIGIVLLGLILNIAATFVPSWVANILYGINFFAATVFAVITAILWWRPKQVAWIGVAGAIIGKLDHQGLSAGAKWLIMKYASIFKLVTMVCTIVLFYLGFMPFGENPAAFFVIVSGGIGASLLANSDHYKDKLAGTLAAELIFYGMCVVISLAVLSIVPHQSWGKDGGFMQALVRNIKGGVFLFAIFLTLITTLSVRRGEAKKGETKSLTIMIVLLFGAMDMMFMPMDMLSKYDPFTGPAHASMATQVHGAPQALTLPSIVATKEGPSEWVRFPEGRSTAYHCNGDGMIYVRHNKTGPEGIGPFPCTPNSVSMDLNVLQNGERVQRLEYLEVRFQSKGPSFLVNFMDCPTSTSCLMKAS